MNSKQRSKNKTQKTKPLPKRNRRRRRVNQALATTQTVRISKCTRDFLAAVVNPFKQNLDLPCIPDLTIIPSHKLKALTRGSFQTGTTGVGWVQYNPWMAIANDRGLAGANIDRPVVATNSAFAGLTTNFTVAGGIITTNGVFSTNSNSSLTTASLSAVNAAKRYRLVAAGLKIRYNGASLRNQGTVYLYRTPGNDIIAVGANGAYMLQDQYTTRLPVSRKAEYIFFSHSSPDITVYQNDTFFLPTGGGTPRMGCLTIFVEGGDITQPQTWDFEAVSYFEIIGPNIATTPSHSDPSGYGAALSSLPGQAPQSTPEVILNSVLNTVKNSLVENASQVINRVVPIAANAAANYVFGSLQQSSVPTITDVE